jgi:hypothetical protein
MNTYSKEYIVASSQGDIMACRATMVALEQLFKELNVVAINLKGGYEILSSPEDVEYICASEWNERGITSMLLQALPVVFLDLIYTDDDASLAIIAEIEKRLDLKLISFKNQNGEDV